MSRDDHPSGLVKRAAAAQRTIQEQAQLEQAASQAGYMGEYFPLADEDEYLADCYDRGIVLAAKIGHTMGRLFTPPEKD